LPSDAEFVIADRICKLCGHLPLAIRTAGKIVRMKPDVFCSGMALSNFADTILTATHQGSESKSNDDTIFKILNRSFSFVTDSKAAHVLKICFSSFSVVFHQNETLRPWVSQNAAEMLWAAILNSNDTTKKYNESLRLYRVKSMEDIVEIMHVIGLIDITRSNLSQRDCKRNLIRIHHDLMWEYGKWFAAEYGMNEIRVPQESQLKDSLKKLNQSEYSMNVVLWNELMVESYQEKLSYLGEDPYIAHDGHMLYWLPLHMLRANKFSETCKLLKNEHFLTARSQLLGTLEATSAYTADIQNFQTTQCLQPSTLYHTEAVNILMQVGNYLSNLDNPRSPRNFQYDVGQALILLGVSIQKFSSWHESLECFLKSLEIFKSIGFRENHPDIICTTRRIELCSLKPLVLVAKNSPHCCRLKYAKELSDRASGSQTVPLDLISHPGSAIVSLDFSAGKNVFSTIGNGFLPGIGSKESAMHAFYEDECLHSVENKMVFEPFNTQEGAFMYLAVKDMNKPGTKFIINEDRSMSPKLCPTLCIGVSTYPMVLLVARDSPNRAIFKYSSELLREKGAEGNNISLDLISHPNCALVPALDQHVMKSGCISYSYLGIGPAENALKARFSKRNEIIFEIGGGLLMRAVSNSLAFGNFIICTKDEFLMARRGQQFMVNEEGSISPVEAPHLALGFQVPGKANTIVSDELIAVARSLAGVKIQNTNPDFLNNLYQKYICSIISKKE